MRYLPVLSLVLLALLTPAGLRAEPLAELKACWKDGQSPAACEAPADALLALGLPARQKALAGLLAATDAPTRTLAVWLAERARLPLPDLGALEALLGSPDQVNQGTALAYVESMHPAIDYRSLVPLAESNPYPNLRAAAVRILSRKEAPGRLQAIRLGLRAESSVVQVAAVQALGLLHDVESLDAILVFMLDPNASTPLRVEAVRAVKAIGASQAAPLVYLCLSWPDLALTREALAAFAALSPVSHAILLVDWVYRPDTAQDALRALAQMKSPEVTPKLIGLLEDHRMRDRTLRMLYWTLGQIGDPAAVPALVAQLRGRDHERARLAAEALGQVGDRKAMVPLVEQLQHADTEVRDMALWVLVKISGQTFDNDPRLWQEWLEAHPY
jgi:HEAT repeat protein